MWPYFVAREAERPTADGPQRADLETLPVIDRLVTGYGKMEVLHGLDLVFGRGQTPYLIGSNGAGKTTVLHSIYGFTDIRSGAISLAGRDVGSLAPDDKLRDAGIAYVLQDNSVFPDLTVEENLLMGG